MVNFRPLAAPSLALFLISGCAGAEEPLDEATADLSAVAKDAATVGAVATVLKASEAQAGSLSTSEKCDLAAHATLPLAAPARLTKSGHLELRVAPGARFPNCALTFDGRPFYVFAPHVRQTDSIGQRRDGSAASFREGMITSSDNLKIRYIACSTWGRGPKPVVVLLHPAGADAEATWFSSSVFTKLEERGFCPVAIDLRGHGQSSKPHDPASYDAKRMQRDVIEVLDGLAIQKAHFHGYSLGGSLLIRMLPELAESKRVLSAAFGGAGLPDGRPDDMSGRDRSIAEQKDAEAQQASAAFRAKYVDSEAIAALTQKAPWTQPVGALPLETMSFPTMGFFGDFDSPMQNTRTFAKRMSTAFKGTAVFHDRLHIGTIAGATMPKSYSDILAAFFAGAPVAASASDYTFVSAVDVGKS